MINKEVDIEEDNERKQDEAEDELEAIEGENLNDPSGVQYILFLVRSDRDTMVRLAQILYSSMRGFNCAPVVRHRHMHEGIMFARMAVSMATVR